MTLVDARPQNYWLASKTGKLVDLASIKSLNNQNFLSFETDFKKYFILPLLLEKELNLPISNYFKGNIEHATINKWGLKNSFFSLSNFKESIKDSFINYLSNLISSSSLNL